MSKSGGLRAPPPIFPSASSGSKPERAHFPGRRIASLYRAIVGKLFTPSRRLRNRHTWPNVHSSDDEMAWNAQHGAG